MTLEESILETVRTLPPEKQQEVLDYADYLRRKSTLSPAGKDPRGLWADLDVRVTAEDIAEARREMWNHQDADPI